MTRRYSKAGAPLIREEAFGEEEYEEKVSMEVHEARKILQADPNRRLFAYMNIDNKYSMLFHDEEENFASFHPSQLFVLSAHVIAP